MIDGYRLMIPGPIQLSENVLREMARPMVPHYGEAWTVYYNETMNLLKTIFGTTGSLFAIPGSGSAGLDAAISSSTGPGERWLVLANGFFGERVASIACSYNEETAVLRLPIDEPIDIERVAEELERIDDVIGVVVVHSESSSGLLNPVEKIGKLCREKDLLCFVDAISSLGGIDVRMDEWHVDLCVSASQKCLEGPPGLGLVAVGERGWSRIASKRSPGWYLNLHVWKEYESAWADWHPYPITMPVPALRGLRCGLEAILGEGLETRFARHAEMARYLRSAMSELGFCPVFSEETASPTVVALQGSEAIPATVVTMRLRNEHRILVGGGMGAFKGTAFRVGNMGPQATREQMDAVIRAMSAMAETPAGDLEGTGNE